jgi:hypothetical protein
VPRPTSDESDLKGVHLYPGESQTYDAEDPELRLERGEVPSSFGHLFTGWLELAVSSADGEVAEHGDQDAGAAYLDQLASSTTPISEKDALVIISETSSVR